MINTDLGYKAGRKFIGWSEKRSEKKKKIERVLFNANRFMSHSPILVLMKTCLNCCKEYDYITPLRVKVYHNLSDPDNVATFRHSAFCCIDCLVKWTGAQANGIAPDSAYMGFISLGEKPLDCCHHCGNGSHPSEYCIADNPAIDAFQKVGNYTGEWSHIQGEIVFATLGHQVALEQTCIEFSAKMVKCFQDYKTRSAILYFWADQINHKEMISDITDTTVDPVDLTKQYIIDTRPIHSTQETSHPESRTIIFQKTKKIVNPDKVFFPFDIADANFWWPLTQIHQVEIYETFSDISYAYKETTDLVIDPESFFIYDDN